MNNKCCVVTIILRNYLKKQGVPIDVHAEAGFHTS